MWDRLAVVRTLWLLVALLVFPTVHADAIKAIWIWEEETFRLLDEPEWRDEILDLLAKDGFDTLYLYADSWKERNPIAGEPALYETLILESHRRGFRVEALLGSAYLGTNRYVLPDMRGQAREMIERVLAYNRAATENARFDAIQMDIEPYTLPEWKKDRQQVAGYYVEAAREWRTIAHAGGSRTEIGAAVPFWFDRVAHGEETLIVALLEAFDYVALMAYRDKADGRDGIIEHVRYEVEAAERLGRKVVVGVETDETSLDKLTFLEEGKGALEQALGRVHDEFGGRKGFGGVAIHHLRSYLTLD